MHPSELGHRKYTLPILVLADGLILYMVSDNCVFHPIMSGDVSPLVYINSISFIPFSVYLFQMTEWIALISLVRVHPLPLLSQKLLLCGGNVTSLRVEICALGLALLIAYRRETLR